MTHHRCTYGYILCIAVLPVFLLTSLPPSTSKAAGDLFAETYKYSEGDWRVEKISFEGVTFRKHHEIRNLMDTKEESLYRVIFDRRSYHFDPRIFRSDIDNIEIFYRKHGFIKAEVSWIGLEEIGEEKRLRFRIEVVEGEQIVVEQVTITGNDYIPTSTILAAFNAMPGEPFDAYSFERGKEEIDYIYESDGLLEGMIKTSAIIDEKEKKARLDFVVTEGPVYFFGEVEIEGNERVKEATISRELKFERGEKFSRRALRGSQQKLYNTGLFSMVRFSRDRMDTTNLVAHMKLNIMERKSRWLSLGIGTGTSERRNLRLSLDWDNRNLFGTGRRLRLENVFSFEVGDFERAVPRRFGTTIIEQKFNYVEPWIFRLPLDGSVYLANEREKFYYEQDDGDRRSYWRYKWGETVSLSRDFGEHMKFWIGTEMEWIRYRDILLEELQDVLDAEALRGVTHSVSLVGERDSRDNIFNPSRGTYERVLLQYAGDFLGGDYTFRKFIGSFSFHSSWSPSEQVSGRVLAGYADHPRSSTEVPLHERFFTGGATSIRGYKEREIGDPVGGNVLLVTNCELRFNMNQTFGIVFFVDTGGVWPYWTKTDLGELRVTTGTGLRYQTLIGPLRLDYGVRCNYRDGDSVLPGRLHLSLGHTF